MHYLSTHDNPDAIIFIDSQGPTDSDSDGVNDATDYRTVVSTPVLSVKDQSKANYE